jgi:crotonobetainyl-CoA:carnitine CoA-transferase CaiB-like acyl-CoA transferase
MLNTNQDAPLNGIRVVEFGQFIAVPAAAQVLADLGADVIKVESPTGDAARQVGWTKDGAGPMFSAYNRGKRSVVLDLRSPDDQDRAVKLATRADIVLQNARPGAMEKLGLGPSRLLGLAPSLVYGQVSGFGQNGTASIRPGFDIAAQAESGMMSLNGEASRDPVRVGFTVVDILAGQTLTTGVLAALIRRGITGRGGLVDLSLIDVAVAALSNAWAEYRLTGVMPLRRGNGQPTVAPAADVVDTQDGQVVLSAYTEDHFSKLCLAIGHPELAKDPSFSTNKARVTNRAKLMELLSGALRGMSSDALCDLLAKGGVVAGAIRTMDQIQPGRAGVASDLFVQVASAGRESISIPGLPLNLQGIRREAGRLPALGEHTDEVLAGL